MKAFAAKNGFDLIEEKKDTPPRKKGSRITKEMLDAQQKKDHERMWKDVYIPPPLEILSRKYTNKEPVRTGFNQGLLPNKI
jgi:hypothetical protein